MSSDKTPIRIRGKRHGAKCEKWTARKVRIHVRRPANTFDSSPPTSPFGTSQHRAIKRRKVELSHLEQLPTEMIQAIFVHSGNLDFPAASTSVTSQLSGKQLQWELTCNALSSVVLHGAADKPTSAQLASATRLLNSRFMTWAFFCKWLDHERDARRLEQPESPSDETRYAQIWSALQPSTSLPPPSKVVHGPWTTDHIAFLKVFSLYPNCCATPVEGIVAELAYEGLSQAIEQHAVEVIKLLRNLGVEVDQDLLRKAVVDDGCNKQVVLYLLQWSVVKLMRWHLNRDASRSRPAVDFLDPVLWAWTEKAKALGEPKGKWLTDILRQLSSIGLSEDTHAHELERLERDDNIYISQWQ